jgi:hypothetical protein
MRSNWTGKLIRRTLLLWLCAVAGGCGNGDLPARAPVTGVVTYRGQGLPNADVTFAPESGARMATGRTDTTGRFILGTFSIDDGAVIGRQRVSVIARGPDRPLRPDEVGSGMPGETTPGDPLIPVKYFSPESSGLIYDVVAGKNNFELALSD